MSKPRITVSVPANGEGLSIRSLYDPHPNDDSGWTTIETVLLRFSSDYAPSGRFPVYVNSSLDGRWMGYDAAVCVRKYEPWIIETYNASIAPPTALRIIGKGNDSTPLVPSGNIQGDSITNARYLNTTGKYNAFAISHRNSIEAMTKDNSLDGDYRPYLTVGPVTPRMKYFFNLDLFHRPFLSPMAWDLGDTPNSPQTGSLIPSHGLAQLTFYHTLQGLDPSSRNCTRMRH